VVISPEAQQWAPAIAEAVAVWNQFGDFFATEPGFSSKIVYIEVDETITDRAYTGTWVSDPEGKNEILYKVVAFPVEWPDPTKDLRVAVHELGHVLGLGHDPHPESVMYEYVLDGLWFIGPQQIADLKALYGGCNETSN